MRRDTQIFTWKSLLALITIVTTTLYFVYHFIKRKNFYKNIYVAVTIPNKMLLNGQRSYMK